jgi:hypothetical protein
MLMSYLARSYEDSYLANFEEGFAEGSSKTFVKTLAFWAAYSITGGEKKIPIEEMANCPWLEEGLLDMLKRALRLGLAEGKLIAVASLRRKGYPNIKLDDGTKITDKKIIKFNKDLPF